MTARSLSFGPVAESYERFRPGYPPELVDLVLAHAVRPVRTALEIGAGTGKATRAFAGRGIAVTATDPDHAMLAELRKHVHGDVTTLRGTLEELHPGTRHDLVFAAAALHWTAADGRWSRVAALLEPEGVFASFGGPVALADPVLEQSVQVAHAPYLTDDDVPSPDGTGPDEAMQWPGTELARSELFSDVQQALVPRRWTMTAQDHVGYLSTVSAYLELPPAQRQKALTAIAAVLPPTVEVVADIVVHLARRSHS